MRKETGIAMGIVAVAVVSIGLWFGLSGSPQEVKPDHAITAPADPAPDQKRVDAVIETDESESPVENDVTRIIVVNPDDGEVSTLLSEKVIKEGKVVDR